MSQLLTEVGMIKVGDTVEFSYSTGYKCGRVVDIQGATLSLYCIDNTGGYTLTAPHYNITRVVGGELTFSKQEDIKKPARYNKRGKLECWDVILDQEMGFLEGSVLKYLWRYKEKNGIHDLEKAKVYIDKIIQGLKK